MGKHKIKVLELLTLFDRNPAEMMAYLGESFRRFSSEEKLQTYHDLGQILRKKDFFRPARPLYKEALRLGTELDLPEVIGKCHNALGIIARSLGETNVAAHHYQVALRQFTLIGDREGIAIGYTNLGVLNYNQGEFRKALACYSKALAIDRELGDEAAVGVNCMNQAICYEDLGDNEKAHSLYQQALAIFVKYNRLKSQARCLLSMGGIDYQHGRFEASVEQQKLALDLATQVESPLLMAKCHNNIGLNYLDLKRFREAIEHLELADKLSAHSGEQATRAKNLSFLGSAYHEVGSNDKALIAFQRHLEMVTDIGDRISQAIAYGNLGRTYAARKNYEEAKTHFSRSKALFEEADHPSGVIKALLNLSRVYYITEDLERAETTLIEAQALNRRYFRSTSIATSIHTHLCNVYMDTGRTKEGLRLYQEILDYALENNHLGFQQTVYLNRMLYEVRAGRLEQALAFGHKAVALAEQMFIDLLEEDHILGRAKELSDYYQHLILIALELRHNDSAYESLEKSKSRALIKIMSRVDFSAAVEAEPETRRQIHQERKLLTELRKIQLRGFSNETVRLEPGQTGILLEQLNSLYDILEKTVPAYVDLRRGTSINYERLKQLLA